MANLLIPSRRGFLTALVGLVAAPAIVRVTSLMPIKAFIDTIPTIFRYNPFLDSWLAFENGALLGVAVDRSDVTDLSDESVRLAKVTYALQARGALGDRPLMEMWVEAHEGTGNRGHMGIFDADTAWRPDPDILLLEGLINAAEA